MPRCTAPTPQHGGPAGHREGTHLSQHKLHVAKLAALPQTPVVLMQRALGVTGELPEETPVLPREATTGPGPAVLQATHPQPSSARLQPPAHACSQASTGSTVSPQCRPIHPTLHGGSSDCPRPRAPYPTCQTPRTGCHPTRRSPDSGASDKPHPPTGPQFPSSGAPPPWPAPLQAAHEPHLEPVHLPTADVVVHGAPEDVHGIRDDGGCVEEPSAWQLGGRGGG